MPPKSKNNDGKLPRSASATAIPKSETSDRGGPSTAATSRLAAGLPARPSRSTRSTSRQSATDADQAKRQPGSPADQTAEPALSLRQLEGVQGVCEASTHGVHTQVAQLQQQLNKLDTRPAGTNLDQLEASQRRQQEILESIQNSIAELSAPGGLTEQVRTLRQDTNVLLENQAKNHAESSALHEEQPTEAADENSAADTFAAVQAELSRLQQSQAAETAAPPHKSNVADPENPPVDNTPTVAGCASCQQCANRPRPSRSRRDTRRETAESSDSSDSDTRPFADDGGSSDEEDNISFFNRPKGPRHRGLQTQKPFDPAFDRLMNYRYYRLQRTTRRRDASAMLDGNKRVKALTYALGANFKFSGEDPILIFSFLTRLVEEADLNGLNEAQLYASLPRFLGGTAEVQFRASRGGNRTHGVGTWPEAVQYLLTTYATPTAMREAILKAESLRQQANEDELAFSARLNTAIHRCGNVFSESRKITMFVNGLIPEIQSLVARSAQSQSRQGLRYETVVQNARDEGQAYRARHQVKVAQRPAARQQLQLLEQSSAPSSIAPQAGANHDALFLFHDPLEQSPAVVDSVDTNDLPDTVDLNNQESLLAFNTYRNGQRSGTPTIDRVICWICYAIGHMANQCDLAQGNWQRVVDNHAKLTPAEQRSTPRASLSLAKHFLRIQQEGNPPAPPPKN